MKNKIKAPTLVLAALIFLFFFAMKSMGEPTLEYSIGHVDFDPDQIPISELLQPRAHPEDTLTVEATEDSVIINHTTYSVFSYEARLEVDGNVLRLLFKPIAFASVYKHTEFKGTIENLTPGKYVFQLLHEVDECMYKGEQGWQKWEPTYPVKKVIKERTIIEKRNEVVVEI